MSLVCTMKSKIIIIFSFLLSISVVFGQDVAWEKIDETERIEVYTRKVESSAYKQIKIVCRIKAPISEIVNALEDVNYHAVWVYETEESKIVNKRSYNDFDYYAKLNMPFPAKDRDIYITYNRKQDKENKIVDIVSTASPDIQPPKDKIVRIEDFKSTYKIKPLESGWTEVEYFMTADPGGSLPAWIVNLFTTKGPVQTMKSLIDLIESNHYEGQFIENIVD